METSPLNYQFGEFTLDLARGCVFKAGEEIKLRPKVYETLKYLVEHPGRLIGKQELMQAVWPDAFVTDDSLVQCTLELRRALGDRSQQLLKTVPRRGHLFTAEVTRRAAKPDHFPTTDSFDLSGERELLATKIVRKRHDLPIPRTSLIGREPHLAEAAELLLRRLPGAVPPPADIPKIKAAILVQHGEADTRLASTWPDYDKALTATGVPHEGYIYPKAQHGFHNDTTPLQ